MATEREPKAAKNPELRPGEYLVLRFMGFPDDGSKSVPLTLHGTQQDTTIAYIFQYSFDIVVAPNLSPIHDLEIDHQKVTIYPPFKSRPVDPRFVECMPLDNVPHRLNASRPDFQWSTAPEVSLPVQDSAFRSDSLRIDCPKDPAYEFAATIASKLIALIRSLTGQWWINRGREDSRTHIRHWFPANEVGERLGGIGMFAFFYGKLGFERVLDASIWTLRLRL